MKPKYSERDTRGMLSVDCIECAKGYKGDKSCASGTRIKTGYKGSCFNGILLPIFDEKEI